jgi:hypothetical protein
VKGKVIIKLNEGMENCIFLSRLMQSLHINNCNYKVLKRPKKSYDLESFDGLLEVEYNKESCDLEKILSDIVLKHKATIKALFYDGSKLAFVKHFEMGALQSTCFVKKDFIKGSLNEDLMFMQQDISINLNMAMYDQSGVHIQVIELLSKYPFIEIQTQFSFDKNEDSHLIIAPFFISKHHKNAFIYDLERLIKLLKDFDFISVGSLLAYDADLNMTCLDLVDHQVYESHSRCLRKSSKDKNEQILEKSN